MDVANPSYRRLSRTRSELGLLVMAVLACAPVVAEARTTNTDRILRNLNGTIDNVKVVEEFASAPIAERDRQTATNLLRDVDYALKRATGDLGRISPEDTDDPEVKAIRERVVALTAYREKLAKNLQASIAGGEALTARYRAFRDDIKPYGKGLAVFPRSSGSSQAIGNVTGELLVEALAQLAQLDELCKSKYADLELNDRLAFQLAVNPVMVCSTAAKRQELATAMVEDMVARDVSTWVKMIDSARTGLEKNNGLIAISGNVMEQMVFDLEKAKVSMLDKHKPLFTALGTTVPARVFAPIESSVTALWAEIDRLAPTYTFPAKLSHDGAAEAGAKKAVAGFAKGNVVLKSGMLFTKWDIAKNEIDIPTERYRTGAILFRSKQTKWCHYREFTAHQTYTGGGKFQRAMTFTFAGLRLQQCK